MDSHATLPRGEYSVLSLPSPVCTAGDVPPVGFCDTFQPAFMIAAVPDFEFLQSRVVLAPCIPEK